MRLLRSRGKGGSKTGCQSPIEAEVRSMMMQPSIGGGGRLCLGVHNDAGTTAALGFARNRLRDVAILGKLAAVILDARLSRLNGALPCAFHRAAFGTRRMHDPDPL